MSGKGLAHRVARIARGAGRGRRDDRAAADLIRQRWAQAALPTAEVRLDVRAGVVTLVGAVAGADQRGRVEAAARAPGVRHVVSHLTVTATPDRAVPA
jgi:osmotically-inducible protein OsmY